MRFKFGPQFDATVPTPPAEPVIDFPKEDVGVDLVSAENGQVVYRIPPYSVETHNVLAEIRVYLLNPGSTINPDPDQFVAENVEFFGQSVNEFTNGADVTLAVPDTYPPGNYIGVTILGFDA